MKKLIALGVVTFVGLITLLIPFTQIDVGERGVVVGFGQVKGTLTEGVHFINPLYSVKKFSIRNNKYEAVADSATSDIQKVTISVAVNYNLNEQQVADIYAVYGTDYISKIFTQSVQEAVKTVSAQYPATELITKREEVKNEIKRQLTSIVPASIVISDVSITNVDFADSFDQAIEAKVTAEQKALESKNKLEQTKYEAEQRIAQAKGEAEAIKIQAEAVKNQGGAEYVQLEAIKKWNGVLPVTTAGGAVPFLNIK